MGLAGAFPGIIGRLIPASMGRLRLAGDTGKDQFTLGFGDGDGPAWNARNCSDGEYGIWEYGIWTVGRGGMVNVGCMGEPSWFFWLFRCALMTRIDESVEK
jgi:hypothetical protein